MQQKLLLKELYKKLQNYSDLIGNKIADKITSIEIYIPPEKRQQIIDDLRLFLKM